MRALLDADPLALECYVHESDSYIFDYVCQMTPPILEMVLRAAIRITAGDTPFHEWRPWSSRNLLQLAAAAGYDDPYRGSRKERVHILIEYGVPVDQYHPTWVCAYHDARQDALRRRAYAAACMLVPGFRREHGIPRDVARIIARLVWRMEWRAWLVEEGQAK